ncbi:hypothetical protein [Bythopirellula polymerisocia]|jgi:hypothetical protein|uniref:Uncharacterized protein n=1 Tax=Bythopirellula polymerisocia TaxID=2528003 RepID=A0A5C6D2A6_9BACT|nr:hypothetical protein [Bythopirellula polymerisocia]TWU30265.1 hypothetical protein Pla144_10510 [Bythopirellula polymerisocia]
MLEAGKPEPFIADDPIASEREAFSDYLCFRHGSVVPEKNPLPPSLLLVATSRKNGGGMLVPPSVLSVAG